MANQITPARRKAIAKQYQLSDQYLYQCLTGLRSMSPEKAIALERDTKGEISRVMVVGERAYLIWPELARKPRRTTTKEAAHG